MDSGAFRHLLVRVLLVPIAALTVLALLLGVALRQVTDEARWVDHSDQVIATAYDLGNLITDQETGLRGYMATQDHVLLDPFITSESKIGPRFNTLLRLVADNPIQTAAARQIRADYEDWRQQQSSLLTTFPDQASRQPMMLRQKDGMDRLRREWALFITRENDIRSQRSLWSARFDNFTRFAIVALSLCILAIIISTTNRTFRQIASSYQAKLESIEASRREIQQRQQWLQTTLHSIGDAVIACDAEGLISFMNPIAEQLTGWTEAEAAGLPIAKAFAIVHEATRATVESPVDKVRRIGAVVALANHTILLRRDGTEISIDDSAAPIRGANGEMLGVVLVFRDVTAKRRADQALVRAERLASAGRLSAAFAHEVNNPLEGLMNLLYIAAREDDPEETRELLGKAEIEVGRIAHMTRQSLGFYKDTTALNDFNLADVVSQVVGFYEPRAALCHVALTSRIAANIPLTGSSGEVQQVLSNLLANSLDACPPNSRVRVTARPARDFRDHNGQGIRITVADTGSGIDRHGLAHLFDAFYTTKEKTGTGLGLWVSRQLTEKHGGRIRVRSCADGPKTGTIFSIFLPRISAEHQQRLPAGAA